MSDELLLQTVRLILEHGDVSAAAAAAGVPRPTLASRAAAARARWPNALPAQTRSSGWARGAPKPRIRVSAGRVLDVSLSASPPSAAPTPARSKAPTVEPAVAPANLPDQLAVAIKKRPVAIAELVETLCASETDILDAAARLKHGGMRIEVDGESIGISKAPLQAAYLNGIARQFTAEDDNTFVFGLSGDQHLGSKYERLDVLEALYDAFAEAGCSAVFNTGNWIDGEARFNTHDLHTRGMDQQINYLAKVFPRRPGITTYAVAGDDHEGWYSQREGVDIGRYAERAFRDVGREDWHDLGYMEAPVALVNPHTGKSAVLLIMHPGGGSSYALSYTAQKIIESLDGGEKPALVAFGHYHKLWSGNIRNVWAISTGTTQDQTPFMRKKKLEAHVGGCIVKVTQDPATGALVRCQVEILRYFNHGYYKNRWSHHGPVNQLERTP